MRFVGKYNARYNFIVMIINNNLALIYYCNYLLLLQVIKLLLATLYNFMIHSNFSVLCEEWYIATTTRQELACIFL